MNALVGQEAKANFSLFWLFCDDDADDGGRKDGGDFACAGGGRHLCRRGEFEVCHDGSKELQWSGILSVNLRRGWQRRANQIHAMTKRQDVLAFLISQEYNAGLGGHSHARKNLAKADRLPRQSGARG